VTKIPSNISFQSSCRSNLLVKLELSYIFTCVLIKNVSQILEDYYLIGLIVQFNIIASMMYKYFSKVYQFFSPRSKRYGWIQYLLLHFSHSVSAFPIYSLPHSISAMLSFNVGETASSSR